MKSLKQFFSYMNDTGFRYVVLRNWDNLPNDCQLGEHSDLDLLVYDHEHFFELFPEATPVFKLPRVRTRIPIGDSYLYADIRHIGDGYYPTDLEQLILRERELSDRGFYTPSYELHTLALAYHAVHHKNAIAPEYRKHLGDAKIEELLSALKDSTVGWCPPNDPTVGSFNGYWKGATAVVTKKDGAVVKYQAGYKQYPLIENEADILARLNSRHFPKLLNRTKVTMQTEVDAIEIEDCGELLTVKNCPENWSSQLDEILSDLNSAGVQHRDIKLDNLMVKDGIIKLIDFGWAVTTPFRGGKFDLIETAPPSVLGMPNRAPDGFDDRFSMRRVRKQLDYLLEEAHACV